MILAIVHLVQSVQDSVFSESHDNFITCTVCGHVVGLPSIGCDPGGTPSSCKAPICVL